MRSDRAAAAVALAFFILARSPAYASEKYVLNNGIKVIYTHSGTSGMTHMHAFTNKGSSCGENNKPGITNFMQAMLLKGTLRRNAEQASMEIESMGGSIEPGTLNDYTQVSMSIPTRYFSKGFSIFSDIINGPVFPEAEVEKTRKNILAGIDSRYDEIFPYSYDLFLSSVYDTYPYGIPVEGSRNSVLSITRDDLARRHSEVYAPNNMVFSVISGLPPEEIVKQINASFSELMPMDSNPDIPCVPPSRNAFFARTEERGFYQAYLMMGCLAPEIASADYPAMKLLNNIIGEGGSSRAFVQLREKKGLAYEIGSFFPSRRQQSFFAVYMGMGRESVEESQKEIRDILASSGDVTPEEIAAAKAYLIGKFLLDHESPERQAWYLGWYETLGMDSAYDGLYPSRIAGVTMADIERVSARYFGSGNWVCVRVIPQVKK